MNWFKELDQKIEQFGVEVDARNRHSFVIFSNGAVLLSAICVIASVLVPAYRMFLVGHILIFSYSVFLYYFSKHLLTKENPDIRIYMYLADIPLLMGSMLMGTYFDPTKQAISIVIFVCILPLFIIDKPWRLAGYQVVFTAIFVLLSYCLKPFDIFLADIKYLPIYLLLSIFTNIFTLVERVEGVQSFVMLQHEAEKDALTRLLNRKTGEEKTKLLLEQKVLGTFAIMDVDDFKNFNDVYGHQVGDEILRNVSNAISSVFRTSDVVWRLGGDEFAIYAVDLVDPDICKERFETLLQKFHDMDLPAGVKEPVSVSIGCVICKNGETDFEKVYHDGDTALYQAKALGKGQIVTQK